MRISDWSSDVCSSDLTGAGLPCRPMGGEGGSVARPNIFDISEAAAARAGDLLIEFVDGAPSLILGGDAEPARLRFGFRSEGRRVGKERVMTCSSRWSPYH